MYGPATACTERRRSSLQASLHVQHRGAARIRRIAHHERRQVFRLRFHHGLADALGLVGQRGGLVGLQGPQQHLVAAVPVLGVQRSEVVRKAALEPGMAPVAEADGAAEPLLRQRFGLQAVPQVLEIGVGADVVDHVFGLRRERRAGCVSRQVLHEHLGVAGVRERLADQIA
jgi:hypothetical protein